MDGFVACYSRPGYIHGIKRDTMESFDLYTMILTWISEKNSKLDDLS